MADLGGAGVAVVGCGGWAFGGGSGLLCCEGGWVWAPDRVWGDGPWGVGLEVGAAVGAALGEIPAAERGYDGSLGRGYDGFLGAGVGGGVRGLGGGLGGRVGLGADV